MSKELNDSMYMKGGNTDAEKAAYKLGYETAASLHQCGGWVKASERLPEKRDVYFVKWNGKNNGSMYFNGKRFETYESVRPDDIEWLDESPPL